ncbi:shikimate dehydrogenase [Candidatus Pelagibacter sp. HIMB1485]|uniref:shikimate dehydrogenase n=1 Tax=Candidatus Pelagibacter sp. HIMB1485 TaxID=3415415 RepID=UPI003F86E64C
MKKYFVIGNPINHSLSPKLHNHWFKQNNINAVYEKIKLEENEVKNFINKIRNQEINGCNVTVPFKKTVIPFLNKLSPEAEQTQSVNTICFNNGELVGHNTDIVGFQKAINKLNYNAKNKKILILGAGGVVPSIIFALNKMEVSQIILSNRTYKKAENLKLQFNKINIVNWGEIPEFDIIINATSLGLNNETIDIETSNIGHGKLFYDVIYNPAETNFLKNGKKLGNQTENGKFMFVYQAFEAFKLWHNIEPSVNNQILNLLNDD